VLLLFMVPFLLWRRCPNGLLIIIVAVIIFREWNSSSSKQASKSKAKANGRAEET